MIGWLWGRKVRSDNRVSRFYWRTKALLSSACRHLMTDRRVQTYAESRLTQQPHFCITLLTQVRSLSFSALPSVRCPIFFSEVGSAAAGAWSTPPHSSRSVGFCGTHRASENETVRYKSHFANFLVRPLLPNKSAVRARLPSSPKSTAAPLDTCSDPGCI